MKFDKTNFALASGLTAALMSLFIGLLKKVLFWGGMMPMKYGMGRGMGTMGKMFPMWCPLGGWGIIIRPIIVFVFAAGAGWLFAFLYNKMSK